MTLRTIHNLVLAFATTLEDQVVNLRLLIGRIEDVRRNRCRERGHIDVAEHPGNTASASTDIMEIHCLAQDQKRVGIESPDQFLAVVVQI